MEPSPSKVASFSLDLNELSTTLCRRIIDHKKIEMHRTKAKQSAHVDFNDTKDANRKRHFAGQSGCFCMECLKHRKQEWRIGDINPAIVGPRDQWRQECWGNGERFSLFEESEAPCIEPRCTPAVKETIVRHDSKKNPILIERNAKFVEVASGKYHTLMITESKNVYASGDNTYGALGFPLSEFNDRARPYMARLRKVDKNISKVASGEVRLIATSHFASFAVVVLPAYDEFDHIAPELAKKEIKAEEPNKRTGDSRPVTRQVVFDTSTKTEVYNHVFSWGRGDHGVLGHGDTVSSCTPRVLHFFDRMRVTQISAGSQHVLILTQAEGLFAFGDGRNGRLGMGEGDTNDRVTPEKVVGLEGLSVIQISAGDEHSVAVTGDTVYIRQVYSWGVGAHGRLGHLDEEDRLRPTRINFFRGRKVSSVCCGGAHNLAISELRHGTCTWSWGSGSYGQLGHRDTWHSLTPRAIDELRNEKVLEISAGERHSLAITDKRALWVWGQGIHGSYAVPRPDLSSTSILCPVKISLPNMSLIGARAGRGRTFVWGDREYYDRDKKTRSFGGTVASELCSAMAEYESLSSNSFRILYRCGPCKLNALCVACARRCHIEHRLELYHTLKDAISRDCDCYNSTACNFDRD